MMVCKNLKNGKARDNFGMIFELFKPQVSGFDLQMSLLKLFNGMKKEIFIPDFMKSMIITSLWKRRGLMADLSNQRGIFNLVKVRSILDKLAYQDSFPIIENELSCSIVGGRKRRNFRDHLFYFIV